MKKLLPLILLFVGIGAGVGAGIVLKPAPTDMGAEQIQPESHNKDHSADHTETKEDVSEAEYVELNNQFVVPIVNQDMVEALVVVSLGIELDAGYTETVYRREPKLRDGLLQVMFDHANFGGFRGQFTDSNNMDALRLALTEVAQSVIGDPVRSVVIVHIARQDI